MKNQIFIFVTFLICVTQIKGDDEFPPPELREIIDPLHEICTKRLSVSDDEVKNYKIGDNSSKMMCYMECLMKESKWMSADGVIQYDTIKEFSHPVVRELLLKALVNCMDIDAGSQECELSYNFNVCIQKADPVNKQSLSEDKRISAANNLLNYVTHGYSLDEKIKGMGYACFMATPPPQ